MNTSSSSKLNVHIGEQGFLVGTLYYEKHAGREASSFRYDPSWLENPRAFPLAPSMPLSPGTFRGQSAATRTYPFPSPIADGCPDSWGREIARLDHPRGRGPITSYDYLWGIDDKVRLGALRYAGDDGQYIEPTALGMGQAEIVLQIKDLALSARAIEERKATTLDIRRLRGVGAAMGGARPKATVAGPNGSLFIAKFGCRGEALATEKMEVVVQRLAAKVGINACEASILTNKDFDPVALIRRFDRTPEGKRIPYISARTMLDAESGIGGTYTEIAYAIREHGHDTPRQLHELFRRIAFTILVSNVDDHLMNHGFIHVGGGKWKLSPMFDVNPAPDRVSTLKTPISETSGNEASVEALLDVSKEFDLEAKNAATIIAEMAASISAQWKPMATILGMTATEVRGYNDAFEHEEGRKALTLAGPKVAVRKTAPPGPGDVELP